MILPNDSGKNILRIIGIDPGTTKLGVGVIDIDLTSFTPTVVYATTINATQNTIRSNEWVSYMRGNRVERLAYIADHLYNLFVELDPHVISSEMYFMRRGRLSAFEALVECLGMIKNVVWRYSSSIDLKTFDPVRVKASVGVSHRGTDKEDVRAGLVKYLSNNFAPGFNIDELDEHAVDAVCVAFTCYRTLIAKESLAPVKSKAKPKSKTKPRVRRKRRTKPKRKKA